MTFLEALRVVQLDPTKKAVPAVLPGRTDRLGIVFNPHEHPCWSWDGGRSARIPAPLLLFGEWKVVKR